MIGCLTCKTWLAVADEERGSALVAAHLATWPGHRMWSQFDEDPDALVGWS